MKHKCINESPPKMCDEAMKATEVLLEGCVMDVRGHPEAAHCHNVAPQALSGSKTMTSSPESVTASALAKPCTQLKYVK